MGAISLSGIAVGLLLAMGGIAFGGCTVGSLSFGVVAIGVHAESLITVSEPVRQGLALGAWALATALVTAAIAGLVLWLREADQGRGT